MNLTEHIFNDIIKMVYRITLLLKGAVDMNMHLTCDKKSDYVSPSIDIILFENDVITLSHIDPNMGEWDTDL